MARSDARVGRATGCRDLARGPRVDLRRRSAEVQAGEFVRHAVQPASERELVAGLAFQVSVPPGDLVKPLEGGSARPRGPERDRLRRPRGRRQLRTTSRSSRFSRTPRARARAYVSAAPGGDLNLSAEEIAAFHELGSESSAIRRGVAGPERAARAALRLPNARTSGHPALRAQRRRAAFAGRRASYCTAAAAERLENYAPAAYQPPALVSRRQTRLGDGGDVSLVALRRRRHSHPRADARNARARRRGLDRPGAAVLREHGLQRGTVGGGLSPLGIGHRSGLHQSHVDRPDRGHRWSSEALDRQQGAGVCSSRLCSNGRARR